MSSAHHSAERLGEPEQLAGESGRVADERAELQRRLDGATEQVAFLLADLRRAEVAAHQLNLELTAARNDLVESWMQVQAMRRTVSWRVTAPLRAVRRLSSRR